MLLSPEPQIAVSPAPERPRCAVETLHEQGSGLQNEDVLLRADDLLGVFDGATSLDGFLDKNGASGGYRAAQLAAEVEEAVVDAGLPPEDRPFRAHLSLSRIRPPRDVGRLLESVAPLDVRMAVERIVLYRSHLGRGGARYEEVEEFTLA